MHTEDVAGLDITLESALSLQHLLCLGGTFGCEDIGAALANQKIQLQCPFNPEKQTSSSRDLTLRFRIAFH